MKTKEEVKAEYIERNVTDAWTPEEVEEKFEAFYTWYAAKMNEKKVIVCTTANVEKETEKAIYIKSYISEKKCWIPKSVSVILENGMIEIASWFASKERISVIW